jgi:MYXO-CTERM domain-containing protein
MKASPPAPEAPVGWRARWCRWLVPVFLLLFTPKCLFCVLAYAGFGAALGFGGAELCGATGDPTGPWTVWLPALVGALAAGVFFVRRRTAGGPGLFSRKIR